MVDARLCFYDRSYLDVHMVVDTYRCYPQHQKYSFQYVRDGRCAFRYDNAPDHRELETFPDHKHTGPDGETVVRSEKPSLNRVILEVHGYFRMAA